MTETERTSVGSSTKARTKPWLCRSSRSAAPGVETLAITMYPFRSRSLMSGRPNGASPPRTLYDVSAAHRRTPIYSPTTCRFSFARGLQPACTDRAHVDSAISDQEPGTDDTNGNPTGRPWIPLDPVRCILHPGRRRRPVGGGGGGTSKSPRPGDVFRDARPVSSNVGPELVEAVAYPWNVRRRRRQ